MSRTPLTRTGAEKLKEELRRLKTVDRPAAIVAIAEARSHGDLSENAEYDAAKDRQGFLEVRIRDIETMLAQAQIVDPAQIDADGQVVFGATVDLEDHASGDRVCYQIVGDAGAQVIDPTTLEADGRVVFGATVEIEDADSGERSAYQIVGDDEADIKAGKISVNSPIARALIGKHAGDTAEVKAPAGLREYEVLAVRYV